MTEEKAAPSMNGDVTSDDKLWAALVYVFPILGSVIIMLLEAKKDRTYIKAHTAQALVAGIVYWIISGVTLGCGSILWFVFLYWAYQAYQGEMVQIPVVTDFVKNQGWA